jgi:multiple sugar transport system permease protein
MSGEPAPSEVSTDTTPTRERETTFADRLAIGKYATPAFYWFLRIALALFILTPLYNAFLMSLTPLGRLGVPILLPEFLYWENYLAAYRQGALRFVLNSLFYATAVTVLNLSIAVPAAYSISRYRFVGRKLFMFVLLVTQMFAAIIIIPGLFKLAVEFGLIDTYLAVIIPLVAINLALAIWLLKGFFDSIDERIEEAAMIDGCGRLSVIRQVVMPMSAPGVATAGIFVFINAYSTFLIPLILLSSNSKYPIAVGIYSMFGNRPTPYAVIMAMTLIGIVPIIILYVLAQNYIVEGLTSGGVKA